MTQLGLSWLAHKENERHNKAMEGETARSNRKREAQNAISLAETERANRKREDLTQYDNRRKMIMDDWNRQIDKAKLDEQIAQLKSDTKLKELGADKAALELTRLLPQIDASIINSIVSTLFKSGFSATGMELLQNYLENYTDSDGNRPFAGANPLDQAAAVGGSGSNAVNNVAKVVSGLAAIGGGMLLGGMGGGAADFIKSKLRNNSLI